MDEKNNNQNPEEELFFVPKVELKDCRLSKKRSYDWVEETFISDHPNDIPDTNNYIGLALTARKLNLFFIILFLGVFVLFTRSAYLQVVQGEHYYELAENNRIRVYHIQSPRGIIYDRNHIQLVENIPDFSLYITPVDFPKEDNERKLISGQLATYFSDIPDLETELDSILIVNREKREYYQEHILVQHIEYETALKLKLLTADMPGVNIGMSNQRNYLMSKNLSLSPEDQQNKEIKFDSVYFYNSLSHLLGYVGKINENEFDELYPQGYLFNDIIGKTGLEKSYEPVLRGKYGRKQVEVDSFGKEKKIIAQDEVEKGDNLVLSIDYNVQSKLEQLLRDTLAKESLSKGVVIAMNPQNGEVMGLVSLPSYNNNDFSSGISTEQYQRLLDEKSNPLFNRAVSGEYPSGSTIKPVIAASALEEGIINATTSFSSTGGIRISQWFFPDWKAGGHGLTNVKKALADSVNTFFYIIGGGYNDFVGLGAQKLKEYGLKFGLDNLTGIDLPGESTGFLPSPEWKEEEKNEAWYIGATYHMAIGQGDVLVTPLQVANYTAYFANGSTLYKPRLVKSIISSDTGIETKILPEVLATNVVSPSTTEIVRQGMRQTITLGSARSLSALPVSVAGKTGTAQWGTDKVPHAWFTSFAPYENPELVLTILIEEGEEGSVTAVPIAREFYNWYFGYYKLLQ